MSRHTSITYSSQNTVPRATRAAAKKALESKQRKVTRPIMSALERLFKKETGNNHVTKIYDNNRDLVALVYHTAAARRAKFQVQDFNSKVTKGGKKLVCRHLSFYIHQYLVGHSITKNIGVTIANILASRTTIQELSETYDDMDDNLFYFYSGNIACHYQQFGELVYQLVKDSDQKSLLFGTGNHLMHLYFSSKKIEEAHLTQYTLYVTDPNTSNDPIKIVFYDKKYLQFIRLENIFDEALMIDYQAKHFVCIWDPSITIKKQKNIQLQFINTTFWQMLITDLILFNRLSFLTPGCILLGINKYISLDKKINLDPKAAYYSLYHHGGCPLEIFMHSNDYASYIYVLSILINSCREEGLRYLRQNLPKEIKIRLVSHVVHMPYVNQHHVLYLLYLQSPQALLMLFEFAMVDSSKFEDLCNSMAVPIEDPENGCSNNMFDVLCIDKSAYFISFLLRYADNKVGLLSFVANNLSKQTLQKLFTSTNFHILKSYVQCQPWLLIFLLAELHAKCPDHFQHIMQANDPELYFLISSVPANIPNNKAFDYLWRDNQNLYISLMLYLSRVTFRKLVNPYVQYLLSINADFNQIFSACAPTDVFAMIECDRALFDSKKELLAFPLSYIASLHPNDIESLKDLMIQLISLYQQIRSQPLANWQQKVTHVMVKIPQPKRILGIFKPKPSAIQQFSTNLQSIDVAGQDAKKRAMALTDKFFMYLLTDLKVGRVILPCFFQTNIRSLQQAAVVDVTCKVKMIGV